MLGPPRCSWRGAKGSGAQGGSTFRSHADSEITHPCLTCLAHAWAPEENPKLGLGRVGTGQAGVESPDPPVTFLA
jgi:hypothetical protein